MKTSKTPFDVEGSGRSSNLLHKEETQAAHGPGSPLQWHRSPEAWRSVLHVPSLPGSCTLKPEGAWRAVAAPQPYLQHIALPGALLPAQSHPQLVLQQPVLL